MSVTVTDVVALLEQAYPMALAESWDTGIGMTCGNPADRVSSVLLAVDVDAAVLAQAESIGAQLVVTHHPLLFRPVQSVSTETAKGSLIHRMIRAGIAHYAVHTNADKAVGGVNDALAAAFRLTDTRPLVPDPEGTLPPGHAQCGHTGTGRVGVLPTPLALSEFVDLVVETLPETVSGVRAAGDPLPVGQHGRAVRWRRRLRTGLRGRLRGGRLSDVRPASPRGQRTPDGSSGAGRGRGGPLGR